MAIKKIKAQSPDPYLGKIKGDTEFARLAHLNNVVDQINSNDPRPYKVYTALLTQSGGDDLLQLTAGPVTKGVTYTILANSDGDFSNVGAPDNNENTSFVAINNDTPISYGTDCQLLYNNGAPVVTVLENTIGNIWFTYNSDGQYKINTDLSIFDVNKTVVITSPFYGNGNGVDQFITSDFGPYSPDAILIYTKKWTDQTSVNDSLSNTPIEIRVYN